MFVAAALCAAAINVLCPAVAVIVFYALAQNPLLQQLDKECLRPCLGLAKLTLILATHTAEESAWGWWRNGINILCRDDVVIGFDTMA